MKKKFLAAVLLTVSLLFVLCACMVKEKETTVIFDLGNGETKSYTVKDFSEVEIPSDPTKEGYVFDGWYFDSEYTQIFTLTALSSKEKGTEIKVYSKWTAYSELDYNYEFYLDGIKIGEESVKGMNMPEREKAKKDGYVFVGWYLDEDFETPFTSEKIKPANASSTTRVYAKMKPLKDCEFNIHFNVDGEIYSKIISTGTSFTYPSIPEKTGYTFEGWYLDEELNTKFSKDALASCSISEPVLVYAKFIKLTTVNFYADGTLYETKQTADGKITLPASPGKAGYTFGGWYLDEEYNTKLNVNSVQLSPDEPISVYAKFIKLTTVNFYADGTLYETKQTADGRITLPASPEKAGYTFGGWYLDEEYNTELDVNSVQLSPDEPISVYAKFTKVNTGDGYTVTFYVDNDIYATKTTVKGKITLPEVPKKEHMTFVGWYYDIAFRYKFTENDPIDVNRTLYAFFESKEIIATLKNGDSVSSTKITYGEAYTLTKYSIDLDNNRRFLGWAVEGSDTLITDDKGNSLSPSTFDEDVTLVAVWDSFAFRLGLYVEGEKNAEEYFLKSNRLEEPIPDPVSKEWYLEFDGWYTDRGEKIDLNNHVFTKNLYLTAKFVCSEIALIWDFSTQFHFTFASGFPSHSSCDGVTYDAVVDFIEKSLNVFYYPSIDVESSYNQPLTSGYEILLGPDALYRGDECCVSSRELGETGYVIKVVGNIIVIAGGSDEATKEAFLKFIENFVSFEKGEDGYIETRLIAKKDAYFEKKHEYPIEKITIGGAELREFSICTDYNSSKCGDIAEILRDMIYEVSGYYLDIRQNREYCVCEHHIFITDAEYNYDYEKDKNGDGFTVYVEDGKMVIACLYSMLLKETTEEFVAEYITGKTGSVKIDNGFVYTKSVSAVSYEDFGAVGDGVTDDFEAIYNAHVYANASGQKVIAKAGATYYIGDSFTKTIPVKTSVDFRGATIIINDKGDVALEYFGLHLFSVSEESFMINASEIEGITELHEGDTSIPWISDLFSEETAIVRVVNSDNIIYSKYSGAVNAKIGGIVQSETFIVDSRGNILNGNFVHYNYDQISYVEICPYYSYSGEQVIENGIFKTIRADKSAVSTGYYGNETYNRGISVYYKANLTIKNITHEVLDEPSYNDGKNKAFNYGHFIGLSHCYGVSIIDTKLYAQKEYLGYHNLVDAQFSIIPYDLRISSCTDVTIDGLSLFNDNVMTDSAYNDVLKVVNTKNLVMKNSRINSVELAGILGGRIEKTTIGRVINLVGGKSLVFDEVVRIANKSFLQLHSKYGAYFNGDIIFKNCEMKGEKAYNSNNGEAQSTGSFANLYLITSMYKSQDRDYVNCDYFAGDLTMPYTVTVDGEVKIKPNAKLHVFQDLSDAAFDPSYSDNGERAYVVTKKIIFKNTTPLTITNGTGEILNGIEIVTE